MKIGDKITMSFHGCGVTSLVECKIIAFDDKTVTIDDTEEGRIFNRKNGKCLNDNTFGGFSRTIKPC